MSTEIEDTGTATSAPVTQLTEEQSAQILGRLRLEQQVKAGANQFYWIAGLSLVNSVLYVANVGWTFFVGLAATQIVDGLATGIASELSDAGIVVRIVGLVLDAFIAGMFVFFGYFANKRHNWAFVIGMVVYALDGLVLLLVGDIVGTVLHIFFLWFIFGGLRALRNLNAMEAGTFVLAPSAREMAKAKQAPRLTWRDREYWFRMSPITAVGIGLLLILLVWVFFIYRP